MKISKNEVHLWYAYDEKIADEHLLAEYCEIASEEERLLQKRLRFEKHRHQYLITRVLARTVLSTYIDIITPAEWRFGKNPYNKPYIENSSIPFPLYFNISHTEKLVVMAVTASGDVGVDAEYTLRRNSGLEIAERYFSRTEIEDLQAKADPQKRNCFFNLWTLKEAYVKARGMGMSIPLDRFSYTFPSQNEIRLSFEDGYGDHPDHWYLWQIKPSQVHTVALAVRSMDASKHQLSMFETVPCRNVKKIDYPIVAQSYQLD